ncbi:MAG TPA: orotate phosphoribosyltransferase [Candidatus Saccharimonadales bacterium]|nr:orotate phosphoribosyltransferase [Candidatus Saccharimonadales bacterium]
MNELKNELVTFLFDNRAMRIGNYILSSGRSSHFYIDLRILQSYPVYFRKTITLLKSIVLSRIGLDEFDCICSIPTSGTIFGSSLAYELFKPHIYVRKDAKDYGTQKKIEGEIKPGSRVLFIEDVVTSGNSLLSALKTISEQSSTNRAIVIIDRQQGAAENFKKHNLQIDSVISVVNAVEILKNNNRISNNDYDSIREEILHY